MVSAVDAGPLKHGSWLAENVSKLDPVTRDVSGLVLIAWIALFRAVERLEAQRGLAADGAVTAHLHRDQLPRDARQLPSIRGMAAM